MWLFSKLFRKTQLCVDEYGEECPHWVRTPCYHALKGGMGLMGDAVTCIKCGVSKYPEALDNYDKYVAAGRVEEYM